MQIQLKIDNFTSKIEKSIQNLILKVGKGVPQGVLGLIFFNIFMLTILQNLYQKGTLLCMLMT